MTHLRLGIAAAAAMLTTATLAPSVAYAQPAVSAHTAASRLCPPSAIPVSFSDNLDKFVYDGVEVGGLSDLAWDARSASWLASVDNHGTDPARIWFIRNLSDPHITRAPLVLKHADGTPYDGTNSDNEGLAVLPNGDFVVSSETEPSIRIYGRDGRQISELSIPARFAVTGATLAGQATSNATLEGLTISPDGRQIIAAMEGALSGDTDPTLHRFLVYDAGRHGSWTLTRQIAYRTEVGNRIPEVAAYGRDSLVVEEAAFSATAGNSIELYAVTGLSRAADVSKVTDLAAANPRVVVPKKLITNLVGCPTLDAPSRQPQTNPLLDNYEGMAITFGGKGLAGISLITDDNFSATEFTRVLNLVAVLP